MATNLRQAQEKAYAYLQSDAGRKLAAEKWLGNKANQAMNNFKSNVVQEQNINKAKLSWAWTNAASSIPKTPIKGKVVRGWALVKKKPVAPLNGGMSKMEPKQDLNATSWNYQQSLKKQKAAWPSPLYKATHGMWGWDLKAALKWKWVSWLNNIDWYKWISVPKPKSKPWLNNFDWYKWFGIMKKVKKWIWRIRSWQWLI